MLACCTCSISWSSTRSTCSSSWSSSCSSGCRWRSARRETLPIYFFCHRFVAARPSLAQGELGDAHLLLQPLEQLELHALDTLEQLDLALLDPLWQLLRAQGRSRDLFLSPRARPAQGELGDAHVLLYPLEQLQLHALDMLEQLDLELLEPPEKLELRAPGRSRNPFLFPPEW